MEADHYRNRAICYRKMKRLDLALLDLKRSLIIRPQSKSLRFLFGQALYESGRFEEAAENFDKGELLLHKNK